MAFDINSLKRMGPQNSNAPSEWAYASTDALTVIDGSGYFNAVADRLQVGDFVHAVGNNVAGIAVVASNTRDLSANPPVQGVVDLSNFTTIGAIDSD